jgi:hypothetical protein
VSPLPAEAVPLDRAHPLRVRLDDLLTRCFYSGAGYVFECDPYVVPEDDELLQVLAAIRADDRRHAHVLGALVQGLGGVPQPGVFPWWDLDLNYLTVPCLARFVLESLEDEEVRYEATIAEWPREDPGGRAALQSILADKRDHAARLAVASEAATKREEEQRKAKTAALKAKRNARIAKEKAAAEAARKAKMAAAKPGAAPVAAKPVAAAGPALLDPKEPGISPKERGRRTVLALRAASGKPLAAAPAAAPAAAAAPAPVGAADLTSLPDPNEPGISPKEKGRRQVLRQRAMAGGGGAPAAAAPAVAPAAAPAAAVDVSSLPDPDEPGISPKEKGKRQVMRQRAMAASAAGGASGAPAASAAGAAAPAAAPAAPVVEDLGDPDEPGISPKEKARRTVARMRAKKAAGG